MKFTFQSFFLFLPFFLFSQTVSYKPLVAEGVIPSDFLKTTKEIVNETKDEFTKANSKKEEKIKEKFLIQST